MADHGILFQDAMCQAIEADRKDVTRRLGERWERVRAGDRLWVRQCFALDIYSESLPPSSCRPPSAALVFAAVWYRSDGDGETERSARRGRWRPGIHMPRWASRTLLEVVSVRQEPAWSPSLRLQLPEVDDAEARREGFADRAAFMQLWHTIHHEPATETLCRVEFRRVEST